MTQAQEPAELVLVSIDQGVASVLFNRPHRQNAWTPGLGRAYFDALLALSEDERVRVIVVSGSAGSFSTGADGTLLGDIAEKNGHVSSGYRPYWLPLSIGKPIIGAIAGPCFGIGLQQALCLDFRFADEGAKFSTAYVRRGLIAEMGMSWFLPRVVGTGVAAELLLSGRVVRADEAVRIGLANRVCTAGSVLEETLAFARTMAANCSPRAMRELKGQLNRDIMSSLIPAYDRAEALLPQAFTWPDFAEGVKSFAEKRPAAFPPLAPDLARIDVDPQAI
ncbi:MAG: enoyl-CoA hydratase [Novosphingobium sp.]|nr:MAG: enoyl-CoA hydratase [Novosphingobium sp.]